jgi:hypothetical protein
MREYMVISAPEDLLPQVLRELLEIAADANFVEVVAGDVGRVIHVHPEVAETWYAKVTEAQENNSAKTHSASNGEEP